MIRTDNKSAVVLAFILACAANAVAFASPVVWRHYTGDNFDEFDLIGVNVADTAETVSWYEHNAAPAIVKSHIVIVQGFGDEDAAYACAGPQPLEGTYRRWIHHVEPYSKHHPSAVRIVRVGDNVLLQRSDGVVVHESVLRGKNPIRWDMGGHQIKMLMMSAQNEWPRLEESTDEVFLQTKPMLSVKRRVRQRCVCNPNSGTNFWKSGFGQMLGFLRTLFFRCGFHFRLLTRFRRSRE